MNFFSRAATTALTGLAALGFASSAFAHHLPQQEWNEQQMVTLLNTAESVGIELYSGIGPCEETPGLMGAMFEKGYLLVCPKAHKGNDAELADTIRHEIIHGIQYCLGREMIHPDKEDAFIDAAQEYLHWEIMGYEPEAWPGEAEARVMADILSEEEIAPMLRQACAGHVWPKDVEGSN